MPEVPIEVNALVMKCLEKEPAARFQSMDELLDAMRTGDLGPGALRRLRRSATASGFIPRTSTPGMPVVNAPATPSFTSAESVRSHEVELGDTGAQAAPKSGSRWCWASARWCWWARSSAEWPRGRR